MRATVHGLFLLFGAEERWFGPLRNTGLNLVDRLPVLKNVLMRRAMN
jgi:2-polyprenyl-6-methoxyphenol hydroxylase-like FAD-dependent oxidoreductase